MTDTYPGEDERDPFFTDEGAYCHIISYTVRDEDAIIVFEAIETKLIYAFRTTKKKAGYMKNKYPPGEPCMVRDSDGELAEISLGYETLGLPLPPNTGETCVWILDRDEARKLLPPELKL